MNKKLLAISLRNTSLATLYVFLVSQFLQNGSKIFDETDSAMTPFVMLLIFCFSAAIISGLIFGQALILFLDNKAKEGIKAAIYSIAWLGAYALLGIVILFLAR